MKTPRSDRSRLLVEIKARNRLRAEAHLPLLDVAAELAKAERLEQKRLRWRRRFGGPVKIDPPDREAIRADLLARNALRRESHLPLIDLDVDAEADRLVKAQVQAAFERFLNGRYVSRVIRRAVSRYRSRPGWNFNSITGMMLQSCVFRLMWKRFNEMQNAARPPAESAAAS